MILKNLILDLITPSKDFVKIDFYGKVSSEEERKFDVLKPE